MNFSELKALADDLRGRLEADAGQSIIAPVTLDEPSGSLDELYFSKLLAWCYGLLFESGPAGLGYLGGLLKVGAKESARQVANARQTVLNLRTVRSHNLSETSKDDEHKKRQAEIWLIQNGGDPTDWARACDALVDEVARAIMLLGSSWDNAVSSEEDRRQTIEQLLLAVDSTWPAYIFDQMVVDAARAISLSGVDVVAYRTGRLDRWQELVRCFRSPGEAKSGLQRAILAEMQATFGDSLESGKNAGIC